MPSFLPISVRQPQPNDIVDDPIKVCGVATAFEAVVSVRVRDGNGAILVDDTFMAGGTGTFANFQITVALPGIPSTPNGTLILFEASAENGQPIHVVSVPVVFGRALMDPYTGFTQHTVVAGDTLSGIAQQFYGNGALFTRIFEANRDQLTNPNVIHVGQVLRVPQ
jgi:nucleoid-associated protein YgaU